MGPTTAIRLGTETTLQMRAMCNKIMAIIWIVGSFDTANSVVTVSICNSLNNSRNDHSLANMFAQQHRRELELHGTDDMELKALQSLRINRKQVIMAPHPPDFTTLDNTISTSSLFSIHILIFTLVDSPPTPENLTICGVGHRTLFP